MNQSLGYLHDKVEIEKLLLHILNCLKDPISVSDLHSFICSDESLNYFSYIEALGELRDTDNIQLLETGYAITEKGRSVISVLEDSIPVPVKQSADLAVRRYLKEYVENSRFLGELTENSDGSWMASLEIRDASAVLCKVDVRAENRLLGRKMLKNLRDNVEPLYAFILRTAASGTDDDRA